MLVEFKFKNQVKYPSIPCSIDESTNVYPKEGKTVINGSEYLTALKLGCDIKIILGYRIPFEGDDQELELSEKENLLPFYKVIKIIQSNRSKYPKKTIENLF